MVITIASTQPITSFEKWGPPGYNRWKNGLSAWGERLQHVPDDAAKPRVVCRTSIFRRLSPRAFPSWGLTLLHLLALLHPSTAPGFFTLSPEGSTLRYQRWLHQRKARRSWTSRESLKCAPQHRDHAAQLALSILPFAKKWRVSIFGRHFRSTCLRNFETLHQKKFLKMHSYFVIALSTKSPNRGKSWEKSSKIDEHFKLFCKICVLPWNLTSLRWKLKKCAKVTRPENSQKSGMFNDVDVCQSCRAWNMLEHEPLIVKIGVDTAEKGLGKV